MNTYSFISQFFLYSFLGHLLECVILSVEYKRSVVDRGFDHGPFCIIYGFSALRACTLLKPVSGRLVELYTASMAMATIVELVTANIMVRLFDAFWQDYSHKAFNYRGMVCLESSLAWGLLGLSFFYLLGHWVRFLVFSIFGNLGGMLVVGLAVFYLVDFTHRLRLRMGGVEEEERATGRPEIYQY